MSSVEFRGNARDLDRFAQGVLKGAVAIEQLGAFERRMSWNVGASSGFSSAMALRSGIALVSTKLCWQQPSALSIRQAPTPLKFVLSRGTGPRLSSPGPSAALLGDGVLQMSRATGAVSARCEFVESGKLELLSLEVAPAKLAELLGSVALPPVLETLLQSSASRSDAAEPMGAALFRLLEEILYCDARGRSRQLHLEGKGLELMAAIVDQLELERSARAPLCRSDIERLERARHLLLARMDAPPSLPELARLVGLNEVKLKTGFRALFGNSVFAYLRTERLTEARRLLQRGRASVSEVALRVGYDNPSKFAAAFRKQFGMPPSALRKP